MQTEIWVALAEGKSVRRKSWDIGCELRKDLGMFNVRDLVADDWEIVELTVPLGWQLRCIGAPIEKGDLRFYAPKQEWEPAAYPDTVLASTAPICTPVKCAPVGYQWLTKGDVFQSGDMKVSQDGQLFPVNRMVHDEPCGIYDLRYARPVPAVPKVAVYTLPPHGWTELQPGETITQECIRYTGDEWGEVNPCHIGATLGIVERPFARMNDLAPTGMRWIRKGETLQDGDLYVAVSGLRPTTASGYTVKDFGLHFLRPIYPAIPEHYTLLAIGEVPRTGDMVAYPGATKWDEIPASTPRGTICLFCRPIQGTYPWAKVQVQQGKKVTRPDLEREGNAYFLKDGKVRFGKELCSIPSQFLFHDTEEEPVYSTASKAATDWKIVEDQPVKITGDITIKDMNGKVVGGSTASEKVTRIPVPSGWRLRKDGEITETGDLYLAPFWKDWNKDWNPVVANIKVGSYGKEFDYCTPDQSPPEGHVWLKQGDVFQVGDVAVDNGKLFLVDTADGGTVAGWTLMYARPIPAPIGSSRWALQQMRQGKKIDRSVVTGSWYAGTYYFAKGDETFIHFAHGNEQEWNSWGSVNDDPRGWKIYEETPADAFRDAVKAQLDLVAAQLSKLAEMVKG